MAKGLDKHNARQQALSLLGKDLTRRSGAHCELCDAAQVKLQVFELPPESQEPELEDCLFLCETCIEQIEKPKRRDINHWLCLHKSVWSPVPAAQAISVALLKQFAEHDWTGELLEQAYLEEEVQSRADDLTGLI